MSPVAVTKMSPMRRRLLHRRHLIALHRRLQGADRIDLGDHDAGALAPEARRRTLADIAEAADDRELAGEHHVGRALDAVDQALAAAIKVIEFRFGDAVVDIDRRRLQRPFPHHLVEPVDAGGRLLRDAADMAQQIGMLVVQDLGRVAAVVEHHIRRPALRPAQGLLDAPFVFLLGLPLPGEHRNTASGNRRGGMVLGREDIARAPAHSRAEMDQGLDQHCGLDRHVQAADDARARKGLRRAKFVAQRHQPRHLGLGDRNLAPPPIGERNIGNLVVGEGGHLSTLPKWRSRRCRI